MMPKPPAHAARLEGSRWTPYLFVAPVAVYLLLFQGYPLLQEMMLGFTSTSLLSPADHTFVGVRNYVELVGTDDFRQALLITAIYTVACVVLSIGLGLVAALLLNSPFRGRGVARAMVTIPWAAPPVAVALIFTWMYNAQYGIFNRALRFLGFAAGAENWLDNPSLALPAILIATIWQIFPFGPRGKKLQGGRHTRSAGRGGLPAVLDARYLDDPVVGAFRVRRAADSETVGNRRLSRGLRRYVRGNLGEKQCDRCGGYDGA